MSDINEVCRQCKGCKWWVRVKSFERDGLPMGECRVKSPKVFQRNDQDAKLVTRWPLTVSLDFCGQFREGTGTVKVAASGGAA
jgi:hypothetical protein